jgi:DNA-binding transcriptional LysR family regulator
MPGAALEDAVRERRADVALGPRVPAAGLDSIPFLRARAIVVAAPSHALAGHRALHASALRAERWACGPEASDPATPLAALVDALHVPEAQRRTYPSHAAALAAVGAGTGVAAALAHTVAGEVARGALVRLEVRGTPWESLWCATMLPLDRRAPVAATFGRFVATPDATQAILARSAGTSASRFRPPVYVTIWATDAASS